jgi:CDP-diacylglycerol--glycerol-3-phosphate 3-phosphatidyltransferase
VADRPVAEAAEKARLTFRRLVGLDRSGPPPPQTVKGQPLNPWTIPNAIGYVRLALIPVFLAFAFSSGDGQSWQTATTFAVIAWTDYFDGIAARLTGQYSRMGALLDPLVDRLLVLSGAIVCWHFDLLPHWALAVLGLRELFMLFLVRWGLRHGADIKVNWFGRLGVWPILCGLFGPMAGLEKAGEIFLYVGLAFVLASTVQYVRDGLASRPSSSG